MEFSKYALIPEETLSKHIPTKKHLSDFDREMEKILNSNLQDFEKVQLYYELLKRKTNLQEFNQPWKISEADDTMKEPSKVEQDPPKIKREIIENHHEQPLLDVIPTGLKKQARQLLQYLKTNPTLFHWNKRGEIIYKNNIIPNSNLADLISLILTQRSVKYPLNGKEEFLNVLSEFNVPKLFIKNRNLSTKNEVYVSPEIEKSRIEKSIVSKKRKKLFPVNTSKIQWENF